jgi:hypothetical protein
VPLGNALSQTLLAVKDESGEELSTGEGELYIGEFIQLTYSSVSTAENLRLNEIL